MFTGIVEETAEVVWLRQTTEAIQLRLRLSAPITGLRRGDSIAVNGACLTVTSIQGDALGFDLLQETLTRTNLGALRPGHRVNLERPLRADGRLDGHFVSGHIDCAGRVRSFDQIGADYRLDVGFPEAYGRYVVTKGSVAINGVSLTVAEARDDALVAWIIPHTRGVTNLRDLEPEAPVNLEFDMLAKYVERILAFRPDQ